VTMGRPLSSIFSSRLGLAVSAEVLGLCAEVRLKTMIEHVQEKTGLGHLNEPQVAVPESWNEELDPVRTALEQVEDSLNEIAGKLQLFASNDPGALSPQALEKELNLAEEMLESDADNPELAAHAGKLAILADQWDRAISILRPT